MDVLNQLFATFKVRAEVFHNGEYCGGWAVDTSGSGYISFHMVSYGRCHMRVADSAQQVVLEQGDVVLFPRDIQHTLSSDPEFRQPLNQASSLPFCEQPRTNGTGLVCGHFKHHHPLIGSITEHLPEYIVLRFQEAEASGLMLMMQVLMKESLTARQDTNLVLEKIAETILAMLLRDHLPTEQGVLAALLNPKLAPAIRAIHAEPERKWTVAQLAELCFISRAAFSTLFKQVVKRSPMEYVTQWRLSQAYRWLADDKISIFEAALRAGYESEASFSKAFKRVMQVSPGVVRAQQA